jgi:putative FmdB family regulatory protein
MEAEHVVKVAADEAFEAIMRVMPLFEYECRGCGRQFEAFVTADRGPVCPACHGDDLNKLLSSPGMVGTAGRVETEAIPACRAQGGQCACSHNNYN